MIYSHGALVDDYPFVDAHVNNFVKFNVKCSNLVKSFFGLSLKQAYFLPYCLSLLL